MHARPRSLRRFALGLALAAPLVTACHPVAAEPPRAPKAAATQRHAERLPVAEQNYAYRWLDIAEEVTARDVDRNGARPTVLSRTLAIWATAMFDAWACYDAKAVGSRLGGSLRRPEAERTIENKKKAISFAAHGVLVDLYPEDRAYIDGEMKKLGYDPAVVVADPNAPESVGRAVAKALMDYRHHDGANQLGDEIGAEGQKPYSDYTYYAPVNPPGEIRDPDRWQPITFTLADGKKVTPGFLTPHWYRVKPFAMETSSQFRAPPPPLVRTDEKRLRNEVDALVKYNQGLTKEEKAVVEFMRDGPRSTGQSGHWLRFAQDVSRRDKHGLDEDVKLYFVIGNVAFDAFIACWETKRFYDTSRPWTLIHHYYKGQTITGWAGPDGGTKPMKGEEWRPYSPESFITPPFPGYTSGHATVSGAASKMLELFTGSDRYGVEEQRRHCELTEKNAGDMMTLPLPTFSATAEMAARSRALGGYHIPVDNDVGLDLGRKLAVWSWPKYKAYFDGTATVRP
jgi:hypothetical protein